MKVTCIKSTSTGMVEGKEYDLGVVSASILIQKGIVVDLVGEDYEEYKKNLQTTKKPRKKRTTQKKSSQASQVSQQ